MEIEAKLKRAREEALPCVQLRDGIDISSPPQQGRISFPSPYSPAFRIVSEEDIGNTKPAAWPCVSKSIDVSSSPGGVCFVTCNVVSITNSHAGTHADTPQHFLKDPHAAFADEQYSGSVTVFDLSDVLATEKAITVAHLQQCAAKGSVDLMHIRRLLIRTYAAELPTEWDPDFAHFSIDAARFLGSLPNLVLIGLDSPSMDHPSASPICDCSHGALWAGRVAILEGLDFSRLVRQPCVSGVLWTHWLATQQYSDARGCLCVFYPVR
jgi:kynurenine formamidase